MAMRGQSKVVAFARTKPASAATVTGVPSDVAGSPLYGVAMLKIAMELKKADPRPLDELIAGVLFRMNLPEGDFRAFLAANGGLLRTIAAKRSY